MFQFTLKIWTFPNTAIGLVLSLVNLLFGGKIQIVDGCIEGHGAMIAKLLSLAPTGGGAGAAAMTLGHCIIGVNTDVLEVVREHEHVHVKQYERWGPLFIPAYFIASIVAWYQGKHPYLDNAFEVEAYALTSNNESSN